MTGVLGGMPTHACICNGTLPNMLPFELRMAIALLMLTSPLRLPAPGVATEPAHCDPGAPAHGELWFHPAMFPLTPPLRYQSPSGPISYFCACGRSSAKLGAPASVRQAVLNSAVARVRV